MTWVLDHLSASKLQRLPKNQTVFFFSVGPWEDHGPHLPLNIDLLEAQALCQRAAERMEKEMPGWVGVLLPPLPIGVDSNTTALALTVRSHVLRDWLVDICLALSRS